jgi:hypothetical protein
MTRGRHLARALVAAGLAAVALSFAGCDDKTTPTSPSSTDSTTTTVAAPTTTELFAGRVAVGGSAFYSFTVGVNGTVNVNLADVGGAGVPSTVWLGVGLGTPSGEDCTTSSTVNTAQLTGTYAPGVYCVRVWDIGNLAAVAAFNVTVAHP